MLQMLSETRADLARSRGEAAVGRGVMWLVTCEPAPHLQTKTSLCWSVFQLVSNFCYCTPKTPRSEFILCFLTLSCQVRSEIQSLPWACQDLAETGPGKVGSPLKGEPSWRCLPPDSVMAGVERRGREKTGPRN